MLSFEILLCLGAVLSSSGHIRATVSPTNTTVDYAKSRLIGQNAE